MKPSIGRVVIFTNALASFRVASLIQKVHVDLSEELQRRAVRVRDLMFRVRGLTDRIEL